MPISYTGSSVLDLLQGSNLIMDSRNAKQIMQTNFNGFCGFPNDKLNAGSTILSRSCLLDASYEEVLCSACRPSRHWVGGYFPAQCNRNRNRGVRIDGRNLGRQKKREGKKKKRKRKSKIQHNQLVLFTPASCFPGWLPAYSQCNHQRNALNPINPVWPHDQFQSRGYAGDVSVPVLSALSFGFLPTPVTRRSFAERMCLRAWCFPA